MTSLCIEKSQKTRPNLIDLEQAHRKDETIKLSSNEFYPLESLNNFPTLEPSNEFYDYPESNSPNAEICNNYSYFYFNSYI